MGDVQYLQKNRAEVLGMVITTGESVIGIMLPVGVNFGLLYNKYDPWFSTRYKWYAVIGLFVLSSAMLEFLKFNDEDWYLALRAALTPLIVVLLDYAFKRISMIVQDRDYYLRFRDMSIMYHGRKYSFWDNLLTVVITIVVIFMPMALILIYRKW